MELWASSATAQHTYSPVIFLYTLTCGRTLPLHLVFLCVVCCKRPLKLSTSTTDWLIVNVNSLFSLVRTNEEMVWHYLCSHYSSFLLFKSRKLHFDGNGLNLCLNNNHQQMPGEELCHHNCVVLLQTESKKSQLNPEVQRDLVKTKQYWYWSLSLNMQSVIIALQTCV